MGKPWTDAERDRLNSLTADGKTAREIGTILGRTTATVSTMRSSLEVYVSPANCKACDAALTYRGYGRRRETCNTDCHNALLRQQRAAEHVDQPCEECGAMTGRGRYCTLACGKRAWDQRTRNTPRRRRQMARAAKRYKAKKRTSA